MEKCKEREREKEGGREREKVSLDSKQHVQSVSIIPTFLFLHHD
jgi:hypothetical protein